MKKLTKCFWITERGDCSRCLDELISAKKCKGKCEFYRKHTIIIAENYPDNTYKDDGCNGLTEKDYD